MACPKGGATSVKAHYLLGKALLEQGKLDDAMQALLKSMSLSSSPDFKSYRGSIDAALFLARKRLWERAQDAKDTADETLREELLQLVDVCAQNKSDPQRNEEAEARTGAVSRLLSRGRVKRAVSGIPSGTVCPLTHRIMLDPVTTPFGQTYEREALEKYWREKMSEGAGGDVLCEDPVTPSERFSQAQLMPNLSLKRYIDEFLEANPWAYDEES